MFSSYLEKEQYSKLMGYIKRQNIEVKRLISGKKYRLGKILCIASGIRNKSGRKDAARYFKNWREQRRLRKKFSMDAHRFLQDTDPNYFSEERIAVYTCIIGGYDQVIEPGFIPDNCDYYIVTDQTIMKDSKWKKIDIEPFLDRLNGLSNAEKNRFFKMNPDLLFPEYKYSIYLDGNIKPVTDLTEFINLIGRCGIAAHLHSIRNDVYEEAEVLKYLKRDIPERIDNHIELLRRTGVPENYGLIECNVIAREHHNPLCRKVMQEWWNEFMTYSKRDQISFIHVLYLNGITTQEVGVLGNNVFENPALRKVGHS